MTVVLFTLGLLLGTDHTPPGQRQHYWLDVRICQGDPLGSRTEGTIKYLAEPCVRTQSGRPAHFLTGDKRIEVGGINGPGVAIAGDRAIHLEVVPTRGPFGIVRLDFNGTRRNPIPGGVAEQSHRLTLFVLPGQTARRRIAADSPSDQTWAEVTVWCGVPPELE